MVELPHQTLTFVLITTAFEINVINLQLLKHQYTGINIGTQINEIIYITHADSTV